MNLSQVIIRRICQNGLLLISLGWVGVPAFAVEIPGYPTNLHEYDARELAFLPRYCIYTQQYRETVPGGNNQAEIERWYSVMGKGFHSMHHYCWGLMKTNRALFLVRNKRDRDFLLTDAIGEYDFVIRGVSPDFVMLPEIFTKKGENLIRLGKAEGIVELQRAIGLKPDDWPPYVTLSDYFKQIKDFGKAREWVEKGLAAAPNAKPLQQRLAELSGHSGASPGTPPRQKSPSAADPAVPVPPAKADIR